MNALIVIDMQEAYFKSPRLKAQKERLVNETNRLITVFTARGDMVIHARTVHSSDKRTWTLNMLQDNQGFAFEGADETQPIKDLRFDGAIDLIKTRDSAFHETGLLRILRDHTITAITLAGISAHSCIFHTASHAYAYDIATTIVTSAVGDEDEALAQQSFEYLQREYRQHII